MAIIELGVAEGVLGAQTMQARATYDFAVKGGAASTIALWGDPSIPSGSTITGGYIEVLTQLTSGGAATIAVQVEGAGDIVPATAVASWTIGRKKIIPVLSGGNDLSASTDVRTTAKRDISVVIGTAALTAGKFVVVLFYTPPLA